MPGIYFYGRIAGSIYDQQVAINASGRYVTVLSPPAADLWREVSGPNRELLLVPGAVDATSLPPRGADPYPSAGDPALCSPGTFTGPSINRRPTAYWRQAQRARHTSRAARARDYTSSASGDTRALDRSRRDASRTRVV